VQDSLDPYNVDGFHVQGVSQNKGDLLGLTQVGEPIPAKQALDADDQPVAEGGHGLEKRLAAGRQVLVENDQALSIEDAQVHGSGVQIDAAIESVLSSVETHHDLLEMGGT
jgi:hypothetical protein